MSMHNKEYLHGNIRVGGVQGLEDGKGWRPPAWWFDGELEKSLAQPSHYPEYLPISMVRTELLGWEVLSGQVNITAEIRIPGDHPLAKTPGKEEVTQVTFTVPDFKGVIREDKLIECYLQDKVDDLGPDTVMQIASKTFDTSSHAEVLLDNTIAIVGGGDSMGITGAGVLKWGKVAYVEVSIPETLHDDSTGIGFRPNLLASTSLDSSVGTRWDRTITNVVCDNTHQWALSQASDKTGSFKIKRTKNFVDRMHDARTALGIMEQSVDEFTTILHEWSKIDVSPKQFITWMDVILPIPEIKATTKMVSIQGEKREVTKTNTNSHTIVMNKRESMEDLYFKDSRVAPWAGTKLGVAQLVNTWGQHEQSMKGAKMYGGNKLQARAEGQIMKVIGGDFQKQDMEFLDKLDHVLLTHDKEGVLIPVGSDKPVSKPRKALQN